MLPHASSCLTGASSGFGEAIAWRCAELGAKLILVARRQERLDALSQAIKAAYPTVAVHLVSMDVRDMAAVAALPGSLPEQFAAVRARKTARQGIQAFFVLATAAALATLH